MIVKPERWIIGSDTGVSSKTIWSVMMGVVDDENKGNVLSFGVPHDPADFGRCHRLFQYFPEWKERLHEVSEIFPEWVPMVEHWVKMTELYESEFPTGNCPELYKLMQTLVKEGMVLAGWVKDGPCSWSKENE